MTAQQKHEAARLRWSAITGELFSAWQEAKEQTRLLNCGLMPDNDYARFRVEARCNAVLGKLSEEARA